MALAAAAVCMADGARPPRLQTAAATVAAVVPAVKQATAAVAKASVEARPTTLTTVAARPRRASRRPRPARPSDGEAPPPALPAPELPDPDAQLAKARQMMADGRVADACEEVEAAKAASAQSAPLYRFLGQCYMRSRRTGEAKKNYRRYLELAPNAPDAAFINGILD
jgi:Flp pilus assembly protein TadD